MCTSCTLLAHYCSAQGWTLPDYTRSLHCLRTACILEFTRVHKLETTCVIWECPSSKTCRELTQDVDARRNSKRLSCNVHSGTSLESRFWGAAFNNSGDLCSIRQIGHFHTFKMITITCNIIWPCDVATPLTTPT